LNLHFVCSSLTQAQSAPCEGFADPDTLLVVKYIHSLGPENGSIVQPREKSQQLITSSSGRS
jgi:hypothetical protein